MADTDIRQRAAQLQPLGEKIRTALETEVEKLALARPPSLPAWDDATFELQRDPASGGETLAALWRDARGHQRGCILIHADGNFFAEYDVVQPHPGKPRWFIEAVSAWGRDETIKSEPRLLPMPE